MVTLAVDDKLAIAKQISSMMEDIDPAGFHKAEKNQRNALDTVRNHRPDIVWLDIEMPGMSGLTMAAEIKKLSPSTNIVFITGFPEYAIDAFGMHVSGYVLKPITEEKLRTEIENLRRPVVTRDSSSLYVQCFGNFEVFHRGNIVKFTRALSKEALAYLVDRRGAGCTVSEICSVLWEDRSATTNLKSQCRVIMGALKKDLAAIGAEDAIVKLWNTWSVDTTKFACDYYDFLKNDPEAVNLFRGEYMTQYSWAEMTVGALYSAAEGEISL